MTINFTKVIICAGAFYLCATAFFFVGAKSASISKPKVAAYQWQIDLNNLMNEEKDEEYDADYYRLQVCFLLKVFLLQQYF